MEKLLFLLLGLMFFSSCENISKEVYIIGNWERHFVSTNFETGVTLYHHITYINFTDSGYVYLEKYNLEKYYVNGDSLTQFYNTMSSDGWVSGKHTSFINIVNDSLFILGYNTPSLDTIKRLKPEFDSDLANDLSEKMEIMNKYLEVIDTNPEYPYEEIIIYSELFYKRVPEVKKEIYDEIFINLGSLNSKEIPVYINPDDRSILGDGSVMFNFNIYGNSYFIEPKIKGSIDKTLGVLPKNETTGKYSRWERSLMNKYEWETLDMKITMENYHKTDYSDKDYLQVKIWITEK